MLKVKLDGDRSVFVPGSVLTGSIVWEMNRVPDAISVSLAWSTEGKGDEDGANVIDQSWRPHSESGSQVIRWQLPRGPLSMDGKLIRIRWAIECFSEKPEEEVTIPIVLSHLERPIILTAPGNS